MDTSPRAGLNHLRRGLPFSCVWGTLVRMANARTFFQPLIQDDNNRLEWKSASMLFSGLGLAGVDWVTDTAAHTGKWWIFHAVEDCVLADVQYEAGFSSGSPAGLTLNAGDRIYGPIIGLTLTSGYGELYRAAVV